MGSSHRFISVACAIWLLTVDLSSLNRPTPASTSLTMRQVGAPDVDMCLPAVRYLRRSIAPGSPAVGSSSSPADTTTGNTPSLLQHSSRLKDLPQPFPPQTQRMRGTEPRLAPPSIRRFLAMWVANLSKNLSGMW